MDYRTSDVTLRIVDLACRHEQRKLRYHAYGRCVLKIAARIRPPVLGGRISNFRVVGVEPPPFLAVNFTDVSAAEMQERQVGVPLIRPELSEKAANVARQGSRFRGPQCRARRLPDRSRSCRIRPTRRCSKTAAKPETKYYLPRYRVAEQTVSGKAQFRIKLDQQVQGGTLTVFLEGFPAPKLEADCPAGSRDPPLGCRETGGTHSDWNFNKFNKNWCSRRSPRRDSCSRRCFAWSSSRS